VTSQSSNLGQTAREIFSAALAACSVEDALAAKFPADLDLSRAGRIAVLAAGKGASAMLRGLLKHLPVPPHGILVAPEEPADLPAGFTFFAGGHPLPNAASFAAARAALDLVHAKPDFLVFLISGGASSMLELPLDPAISLDDTVALYRALVHSGAAIAEINCVRKHISAVKGGRFGLAAAAIPNLTLLVSDVPASCLDALASGPTLPDPSTVAECQQILDRHGLRAQFPASVARFFANPPETPKPRDFTPRIILLLSSADLEQAAARKAESLGFTAVIDDTCDDWNITDAADYLLNRLRELRRTHPRLCLISAGEVTVRIGAAHGSGGRNQHFALYAASQLQPSDAPVAILSAGSDGIDGNTLSAGAVLDSDSPIGNAHDALRQFDSGTLLREIGATIVTGPTGNNLRDLRLLLAETRM
jgi:glycerate 2-kinase